MSSISVIIPTYNRLELVQRAVKSVLEQSFSAREIIVVDDGSTDGTPEVLESLFPDIRVIRHERNRGVSAARNTGIKASLSPLIAFLDSDDYWLPGKLDSQVKFFSNNPDAVICQTREIWVRNGRRVNPAKKHIKPSGDIFEASLELCLVSPSAVMIRRSLFEAVGLFDEDLPVCEDYDLWLRISSGHPVNLIEKDFLVREGGHEDQLSTSRSGMDRYRIRSIIRLIRSKSLSEAQTRAAQKVLDRKCRIYGEGCLKRGRVEEGKAFLAIPGRVARNEPIPALPS